MRNIQTQIDSFTSWAVNRMPSISIQNPVSYDQLLINISRIVNECVSSIDVDTLIAKISRQTEDIITSLQPKRGVVFTLDGVKPIQIAKHDQALLMTANPSLLVNSTQFYPGTSQASSLQIALEQIALKYNKIHPNVNFVILSSETPGDALYKLRCFLRSQKQTFDNTIYGLVDDSDQAFLSALSLHVQKIHLISPQSTPKSIIDITLFTKIITTEFALLNTSGQRNPQNIIDDLLLLSLLLGTHTLPKMTFFSFSEHSMDHLFYLYKRIYPFLNGSLSNNGVIYQMYIHLFCHELGIIEDTLILNTIRDSYYKTCQSKSENKLLNHSLEAIVNSLDIENATQQLNDILKHSMENKRTSDQLVSVVYCTFVLNLMIYLFVGRRKSRVSIQPSRRYEENIQILLYKRQNMLSTSKLLHEDFDQKQNYFVSKKKVLKQSLLKSKSAYEECLVDGSKYGERFLEGICEDEDEEVDVQSQIPEITGLQAINKILPGERGYKDQFYLSVGRCLVNDLSSLKQSLAQKYFEGIVWHFASYYREYPSWTWEYNYHFAPFSEDLHKLSEIQISFTRSQPLSNAQYSILMSNQQLSSHLPPQLKEKIYGQSSQINNKFPIGFGSTQSNFKSLLMSEIDQCFSLLAEDVDYIEFSQKVNKQQPYASLIVHETRIKQSDKLLSIQDNGICCEVISTENSNDNVLFIDFASPRLPAIVEDANKAKQLIISEEERESILEQLAEIHKRVYVNNKNIRILERSLGLTVDANEAFNRGLQNRMLFPVPQIFSGIIKHEQTGYINNRSHYNSNYQRQKYSNDHHSNNYSYNNNNYQNYNDGYQYKNRSNNSYGRNNNNIYGNNNNFNNKRPYQENWQNQDMTTNPRKQFQPSNGFN